MNGMKRKIITPISFKSHLLKTSEFQVDYCLVLVKIQFGGSV